MGIKKAPTVIFTIDVWIGIKLLKCNLIYISDLFWKILFNTVYI